MNITRTNNFAAPKMTAASSPAAFKPADDSAIAQADSFVQSQDRFADSMGRALGGMIFGGMGAVGGAIAGGAGTAIFGGSPWGVVGGVVGGAVAGGVAGAFVGSR